MGRAHVWIKEEDFLGVPDHGQLGLVMKLVLDFAAVACQDNSWWAIAVVVGEDFS